MNSDIECVSCKNKFSESEIIELSKYNLDNVPKNAISLCVSCEKNLVSNKYYLNETQKQLNFVDFLSTIIVKLEDEKRYFWLEILAKNENREIQSKAIDFLNLFLHDKRQLPKKKLSSFIKSESSVIRSYSWKIMAEKSRNIDEKEWIIKELIEILKNGKSEVKIEASALLSELETSLDDLKNLSSFLPRFSENGWILFNILKIMINYNEFYPLIFSAVKKLSFKTDSKYPDYMSFLFSNESFKLFMYKEALNLSDDERLVLIAQIIRLRVKDNDPDTEKFLWELMKNDRNKKIRGLIKNINPRINYEETQLIEVYHERVRHYDEKVADESYFILPILIELLNSQDVDVKINAIRFIRKIGGSLVREAIDPLIKSLKDENAKVRGYAAYALGDIGYPDAKKAVQPLIEILKDPIDPLRYNYYNIYDSDHEVYQIDLYSQYQVQAARALKKIGIKAVSPYLDQLISILQSTGQVESGIPSLSSFDDYLRRSYYCQMLNNKRREILRAIKFLLQNSIKNLKDNHFSIFASIDQIDIFSEDYSYWEIRSIYETQYQEDEILDKNNLYDLEGISEEGYRDSNGDEDYREWFDDQVMKFQIEKPLSMYEWLQGLYIKRTEVPRIYGHYMEAYFEPIIPFLVEAAALETSQDTRKIIFRKYAIWALGQCTFSDKKEMLFKPLLVGLQDPNSEIQIEAACAIRKLGLTSNISRSFITELCNELFSKDNSKRFLGLRILGELHALVTDEILTIIESFMINDPLVLGRAGMGVLDANNWIASSNKLRIYSIISKRSWAEFKEIKNEEVQWLKEFFKKFNFWIKRGILSIISEITSSKFLIWEEIIINEFRNGPVQLQEIIIHNLAKSKQKEFLQLMIRLLEERGSYNINFESISKICLSFGEKIEQFPILVLQGLNNFYQDNSTKDWYEAWQWKSLCDTYSHFNGNLDDKSKENFASVRKLFVFGKKIFSESNFEICSNLKRNTSNNAHLPRLEEAISFLQMKSKLDKNSFFSSIEQILICDAQFSKWEYIRIGEIVYSLGKKERMHFLELYKTLREKDCIFYMYFPPDLLSEEVEFLKHNLKNFELGIDNERSDSPYPVRFDKELGPWLLEGLISKNSILRKNAIKIFCHERSNDPLIKTGYELFTKEPLGSNSYRTIENMKEPEEVNRDLLKMMQLWIISPENFLHEILKYMKTTKMRSFNFWHLISAIVENPCYDFLPWFLIEGKKDPYIYRRGQFGRHFIELNTVKLMKSFTTWFKIEKPLKNELEDYFKDNTDICIDYGCFSKNRGDYVSDPWFSNFQKNGITFLKFHSKSLKQKFAEYDSDNDLDPGIQCLHGYRQFDPVDISADDLILISIPLTESIRLINLDASSSDVLQELINEPNSSLQVSIEHIKEISSLPVYSSIDIINEFLPGLKKYKDTESYWSTINKRVSKEYFIIPYILSVIGSSEAFIHQKISLLHKFSNVSSNIIIDTMLSTYSMHPSVQETLFSFRNAKTLRLGLGLIINNRKEIVSIKENSEMTILSDSQNIVLFTLTEGGEECLFKPFLLHRKGFLTAMNKFALIPDLDNPILVEFNNDSHDMLKKKVKDCDNDLQAKITLFLDYLGGLEEIE